MAIRIAIDLGFHEAFACEASVAVELGRQRENEPAPYHYDGSRLVIAPAEEVSVSRSQLLVEPLDDERVMLRNGSQSTLVDITSCGYRLAGGESRVVQLPAACQVGGRVVRIMAAESLVHTLSHPTQRPGESTAGARPVPTRHLLDLADDLPKIQPLIRTLQQIVDMLQYANSDVELFGQACAAATELLGLQSAEVFLLHANGAWVSPGQSQDTEPERQATGKTTLQLPSVVGSGIRGTVPRSMVGRLQADQRKSLDGVLREKRVTFEFTDLVDIRGTQSPQGFMVAAPLLNRAGEVMGVLCASQSLDATLAEPMQVAKLQAQLLEMIACAVSSALVRLEQESRRKSIQRQFDQFFSKTLSHHLQQQPDLLEGREAEVSLLFCDIRDFTRHSEKLHATEIFSWVNDVMETLSTCVMAHEGVLVDYIGDELIAMWGAPEDQPDHALRACRAASDMLGQLPRLNERWSATLQGPLQVGIGVNTGQVRVGNTGSQQKFKYGPLGPTVNVASRIQGATKYADCPILISDATLQQLRGELRTRPICQVRLVNVEHPIMLHELVEATDRDPEVCAQYAQALELFSRRELDAACRMLGSVLHHHPHDGPSRILLKRTLEYLIDDRLPFDAAWSLPGK